MKVTYRCDLGNRDHYLFTLCSLIISLELLEMVIRIVMFRNSTLNENECNETNLLLTVLLVALGELAPLGFVAMTDVISLPAANLGAVGAETVFDVD
jgi:hypothetical protein